MEISEMVRDDLIAELRIIIGDRYLLVEKET